MTDRLEHCLAGGQTATDHGSTTMRRDHRRPFDIETDEASDVTQQFWGTTRGWAPPSEEPGDAPSDDRTPRSLQSIKSSFAGMRRRPPQTVRRTDASGRVDRTRSHGIVRPGTAELDAIRREATLGELAAGWIGDDEWPDLDFTPTPAPTRSHRNVVPSGRDDDRLQDAFDDDDDEFDVVDDERDDLIELSPVAPLASKLGLGAVDPLLARLGMIVIAGVLLVPLALSARGATQPSLADVSEAVPAVPAAAGSATSGTVGTVPIGTAGSGLAATPRVVSTAAAVAGVAVSTAAAPDASLASTDDVVSESAVADVEDEPVAQALAAPAADVPQAQSVTTSPADVATVSEPADRVEPDCSLSYEAGPGDSWYRIADAAGVSPRALMDQNLAGVETPIFPGDTICLPAGATIPAKPVVTTATPATATPTRTTSPTTTSPTTTTVKPTTSPPPAPVSTDGVQELIREIWPDELEEKALQIAWRESNYRASAYNGWCCYGVFQMHWGAHQGWLDDYGITSTNDLLDARKNITAAYALYQRSGGWGPWGG
jgi:hypothetical protein